MKSQPIKKKINEYSFIIGLDTIGHPFSPLVSDKLKVKKNK